MQAVSQLHDKWNPSFGRRRGLADLACFSLDLTSARVELKKAARSRGYPSPPMSGTPPIPPKQSQEAGDRRQDSYRTTSQDVYRGVSTTQADYRMPPGPPPTTRPFQADPLERIQYPYSRAEESLPRPTLSYPAQTSHNIGQSQLQPMHQGLAQPMHQGQPQPPSPYLPMPGGGPATGSYQASPQPPTATMAENPQYTSPKTQRKTKGHVASACVPCKRAHLRCDAQRPCSRCLSNGKEEACIDVVHKKRGRPRLREDHTRYDAPPGGIQPRDNAMRRPLSLYGPSSAVAPGYDDSIRRTQSYRVLKSQPADPVAPRYLDRASAANANIHPAPLSIATRPEEPAAYLTMNMDIAKASSTFADAIGRQSVRGMSLTDVVVQSEGGKIFEHSHQLSKERERNDPHYLPPIFANREGDRVLQSLGFSSEELSRYNLDRHDSVTFAAQDGRPRHLPIRLGLAKHDSTYFIVIHLKIEIRPLGHPTPSPHLRDPRELPYAYQPLQPHQPQQMYAQPTPMSATFDPARPRGLAPDPGYGPRPGPEAGYPPPRRQSAGPGPGAPGPSPGLMPPGLSPGFPSSYAASPSRPDYPPGPSSYQVPRSELAPGPPRPPPNRGIQLPAIQNPGPFGANPPSPSGPDLSWDPSNQKTKLDIGGLIEKPDQPTTRPQ